MSRNYWTTTGRKAAQQQADRLQLGTVDCHRPGFTPGRTYGAGNPRLAVVALPVVAR